MQSPDWMEIQLLQRIGVSTPRQTAEALGPHCIIAQTQPGPTEGDSENSGPSDVAHSTLSTDADMVTPLVHRYAQDSSNSVQRGPWLLA